MIDCTVTSAAKYLAQFVLRASYFEVSMGIDKARVWLVEKGYDKSMVARPRARVIQEKLKNH